MSGKKLVRPLNERKISGVCAGIAQYLGIDATVVRILWVIISIFPLSIFGGVIAYIACLLIIPEDDGTIDAEYREK